MKPTGSRATIDRIPCAWTPVGQAFSNIVNVPSMQNPNLDRVEPNEPGNSYLVHKVEGTAGGHECH